MRIATLALAVAATVGVSASEPAEMRADESPTRADDPSRLHELADSLSHHPVWQLALLERAYQGLADTTPAGAPRALYARRWLAALLRLGLTDEAVTVFESFPASLRATTLEFAGTVRLNWYFNTESTDLRMEFAAACILEGRLDLAKRLVVAVAAELDSSDPANDGADSPNGVSPAQGRANAGHWKPPELGEDGDRLAILRRTLEPSDTDPFGLLVGAMVDSGREPWFHSVTWRRLLASLADQEGYPSMARFQRRNAGRRLNDRSRNPDRVPESARTPDVAAAVSRATSAIERLKTSLERTALDRPATATSASGVDETIRRLLAAPSIAHIREQSLPNGMSPVTPASIWEQERARADALRREHKLPLPIIRVDRQGSSIVALGASHDYDPVASTRSSGAYWVFRSHDGGVSWDPPLYTGLRAFIPYLAVPESHLPMIGRTGIRLEVQVREGDPDYIFFPGGFARYKRREDGLFVELPWELLERDSDGDGLTDLAEERLLTDPHDADTDRDGLDDRRDPLPHVVHSDAADGRASLMGAILKESDGGPFETDNEKTVFVVALRAHFRGTQPVRRTIVLSSEEHAASVVKFGTFFPTDIELIMINQDGKLAFAIWSAGWHGGTGIFEKVGTKWVKIGGMSWIS